jgi:hypothetical protein
MLRHMAYEVDPRVDEYIDALPPWQQDVCREVRDLYDGAIVPDPDGIITGGHDNKTARTVAVHQGGAVPAAALAAMFRQIVANNRAGGWRKLKREG